MVFYMLLLGSVTFSLAAPGTSPVGMLAGGIFVYAISGMDAYRVAALRRQQEIAAPNFGAMA